MFIAGLMQQTHFKEHSEIVDCKGGGWWWNFLELLKIRRNQITIDDSPFVIRIVELKSVNEFILALDIIDRMDHVVLNQ